MAICEYGAIICSVEGKAFGDIFIQLGVGCSGLWMGLDIKGRSQKADLNYKHFDSASLKALAWDFPTKKRIDFRTEIHPVKLVP
jgi:hypothetical protein